MLNARYLIDIKSLSAAIKADSERLLFEIAQRSRGLALIQPSRLGDVDRATTGLRIVMRKIGMKAASALLSTAASTWFAIGSAAAADMPVSPPAPPPTGYYAPPVEPGYVAPPPPAVYAYPVVPVYPYYAPPPVAVIPRPYYVRPYYGWGYGRPFYGAGIYARGYGLYGAGRYRGYYR